MLLQQAQQPSALVTFLPFVFILAILYLIVLRPARTQQKKLEEMIRNLKTGDKVVTSGGLFGTVVALRTDRIQVRIAENVKVEMSRNAVTAMQPPEEE